MGLFAAGAKRGNAAAIYEKIIASQPTEMMSEYARCSFRVDVLAAASPLLRRGAYASDWSFSNRKAS